MAYTAIDNPELYFQAKLYTGDGSIQAITLDGDTDMSPNLVIQKDRGNVRHNNVYDSVRGVKARLRTDATNAEYTADATNGLDSFDSDGFTLEADSSSLGTNESSQSYVAWCWKESADAGFDIVAYTGDGATTLNVSHGLGVVPSMIIVKSRATDGRSWAVYHHKNTAAPETDFLELNTTAATSDNINRWYDTAPTSSVFTVGTGNDVNASETYIAYLFAEKQGFSSMGSYIGNANADGTFVWCGFRPAFILFKRTDSVSEWSIFDTKRNTYNVVNHHLYADLTNAEGDDDDFDILSNGFKQRRDNNMNKAGTYVYMAFAEAPFVNSNGVPCNAR
jgi:hypothetical protein